MHEHSRPPAGTSHPMDSSSSHAGSLPPAHGDHFAHARHAPADYQRRFWICLVLTLPILAFSSSFQAFLHLPAWLDFPGSVYLLLALSSLVYFYGGFPFLKGGRDELKGRHPGMMTLIAVATSAAYLYSAAVAFGLKGEVFFWELATLIDVMLLGHWLEMRSISAASSATDALARMLPATAHQVQSDGAILDRPSADLTAGDRVLVKPGEKVPADGMVVSGQSSVDESLLTGESTPLARSEGSRVLGGSLNGEGAITVEVRQSGAESYLAQVGQLVNQARESKSRAQGLADRAAFGLVLFALGAGLLTFVLWLTAGRQDFVFALARGVTVLVIACPHALGLAVPLVIAVSTGRSASRGILIKDRDSFEQARNIQAVLCDKTGTLTRGQLEVTDALMLDASMTQDELLSLAASVEQHSQHPIARAILASARDTYPLEDFQSLPGRGARARVRGRQTAVVSKAYLQESHLLPDDERVKKMLEEGQTVVFVLVDNQPRGAIALADSPRPESRRAVEELKALGIRCLLVTGDSLQAARRVAREVGLDEYFAEVLPEGKAARVRETQARGLKVAMTGDGVNDAPALAQADLGIAMGAGTDVASASADVVLVKNNPLDVVTLIKLSSSSYRKMQQNLWWAVGYNLIAIPLAAGAAYSTGLLLAPAVGAALMAASTIIVALNARSLRMPAV